MKLKIPLIILITILILGGIGLIIPKNKGCILIDCSSEIRIDIPQKATEYLIININNETFDLYQLELHKKMQKGIIKNDFIYKGKGKIKFLHVKKYEDKTILSFNPIIEQKLIEKISISISSINSQKGTTKILYPLKTYILNYKISKPNGKKCEPTCYNAKINLS